MKTRASERGSHGVAGVFMGRVKVSAPERAVIVGDTLIKMFWKGFQEVTGCGVQTIPFTWTHREVCAPVCVHVCVCLCLLTRVNAGETDSSCPLARLWQACLKLSKIDCFVSFGLHLLIAFFSSIFLLLLLSRPPFYETANSISTWQSASHCLFFTLVLRRKHY